MIDDYFNNACLEFKIPNAYNEGVRWRAILKIISTKKKKKISKNVHEESKQD